MVNKLKKFEEELNSALSKVNSEADLMAVRVDFLGRKGKLSFIMKQLKEMPDKKRRRAGKLMNELKTRAEFAFQLKVDELEEKNLSSIADTEWMDMTLPGRAAPEGHLHITSQAIAEIEDIFARVGFTRVSAPDIDWDWYAFESLNLPKNHPARDGWETFFVDQPEGKLGKVVLTPHTSNSQVRELEKGNLPIRMINIGRCYRRQVDISHNPMFHQFEGFMVDEGLSVKHLKGVLDYFAKQFFGADREIRLRPHHFRFTEPSFEVDISCGICKGSGENRSAVCRICKAGWLELAGAGMTHPNVLKAGGIDPDKYSAFAFGFGVERTLMMREGTKLNDIRLLHKNDLRFVNQF